MTSLSSNSRQETRYFKTIEFQAIFVILPCFCKLMVVKHTLIAGFYQQWTHEDLSKDEAQQLGIDLFISQIETAAKEKRN